MTTSIRSGLGVLALLLCTVTQADEQFLDAAELESLQEVPGVPGAFRYITPGATPSDYERLIIGSVSFYFSENSRHKSIDADEMQAISDALKTALLEAASGRREIALSPGAGTGLINLAVTEIELRNKRRGLLGYTPVGLLVSTTRNLVGLRVELRNARIEGELVDSETGEVVSVFRLEEFGDFDGEERFSWSDLVGSFEEAANKTLATWD